MKVAVNQEHITTGICNEPRMCALALAINEQLLPGMYAKVKGAEVVVFAPIASDFIRECAGREDSERGCSECNLSKDEEVGRFDLPKEAINFIEKFDAVGLGVPGAGSKKSLRPFSFEL